MSQDDRNFNTSFSDMASQLYPDSVEQGNQAQQEENSPQPANNGMASYVMQKGDTLWGVSQATGIPLEDIQSANPHVGDPTRIPVGTALNLPFDMQSGGKVVPPGEERAANFTEARGYADQNQAGNTPGKAPSQQVNAAETPAHAAFADNQAVDEETRKKYGVEPGTTWRVLNVGQKVNAIWRETEKGTATRAETMALMDELAKLRAAPDLSHRELQEVRAMVGIFAGVAHPKGTLTFDEVMSPLYMDSIMGTPSGGGAARMPRLPLGAGMNMVTPRDPSVIRLNQEMGQSLPRSPLPRDLPALPTKRRQ
jgi:LysM repeat protein